MSYPQPDPNKYAIGGQKFWRLNTPLLSDGDIYESEQGAAGFAIGPDSDISKVNIAYFDDQVSGFQNQVSISPQRPFPGTMYARNDSTYVPSNRPGRFLIWPAEFFRADERPEGFQPNTHRFDIVTPRLDVIEYFSPLGLNAGRNDKEYRYQFIPFGPSVEGDVVNTWWLQIPFYGRRYASIEFFNANIGGATGVSISVHAVTFATLTGVTSQRQIVAPVAVASGVEQNTPVRSSTMGMFDMLLIKLVDSVPAGTFQVDQSLLSIRVSDTEV